MKKLILGLGLLSLSVPMMAQDRAPADDQILAEQHYIDIVSESEEAKQPAENFAQPKYDEKPADQSEQKPAEIVAEQPAQISQPKFDSKPADHEVEIEVSRPVASKPLAPKKKEDSKPGIASSIVSNPEAFVNNPAYRQHVNFAKSTLNLGSDEELIAMVKKVNPAIVKKVEDLNIDVNPIQAAALQVWALKNKEALVASLITGKFPEDLMKEVEVIVPELKKLPKEDKVAVFQEARKTVNNALFESMVKAEVQLGYLAGDTTNGGVAQINARLLNLRKITIGDITIEDLHAEVQVGYPQNGILLLTGKVQTKDSKFSYQGQLLGLSHDIRKKALNFNIAEAQVNYSIFPWLQGHAGLGIGVRSYTDTTVFSLDPKVGVEAKKSGASSK